MDDSVNELPPAPPSDAPARPGTRRAGRPTAIGGRPTKQKARDPARDDPYSTAHVGVEGERLKRKRRVDDPFYFNPRWIPDGYSYEWKRVRVHGAEDPEHMVNLRENHWRAVPAGRHPHMMPDGYEKNGPILRKGMMLMERPSYLTKEAQDEDYAIAREQVQMKEQSLLDTPDGQLTRSHPTVQANSRIRKGRGPLVVEE